MGKIRLGNRGDTLVEVLIAISVVGTVLAGAFSSSARSVNGVRLSQERGEALKLAENQVEMLKALSEDTTVDLFDPAMAVSCLSIPTTKPVRHDMGTLTTVPSLNSDNFGDYPASCRNGFYRTSVEYTSGTDTFTVRTRWDGPTATRQEVVLFYRIHETAIAPPPAAPVVTPPPAAACVSSPATINIPEVFPPGETELSNSHLYYNRRRDKLTYSVDISGATSGMANSCRLNVILTTRDPGHPDASNDQPNERLYARFFLRSGGVVETRLTDDIPRGTTNGWTTNVGTFTFSSPPDRVEFRHYYLRTGDDSSANSVDPQAIRFQVVP